MFPYSEKQVKQLQTNERKWWNKSAVKNKIKTYLFQWVEKRRCKYSSGYSMYTLHQLQIFKTGL